MRPPGTKLLQEINSFSGKHTTSEKKQPPPPTFFARGEKCAALKIWLGKPNMVLSETALA